MNKKIFTCFLMFFITLTNINCMYSEDEESIKNNTIEKFETAIKNDDLGHLKQMFLYYPKEEIINLLQHILSDPDSFNKEFIWTCLHYTIIQNQNDMAKFIITKIIKLKLSLNVRDAQNNTALHYAAIRGNLEIAQLLVDNGASIYVENNQKETPLGKAKQCSQNEVVDFLEKKLNEQPFWNENQDSDSELEDTISISSISDSEDKD